jgi:hypothetical protein
VSSTAIRHVFPSLPIDDILDGLVRNYVVSYNSEEFSLHALDQQYIYHCIHDTEGDYSKIKLHNKAAGYFRKIRKAVDEWKSYVDIESQIHEIHHLIKSRNFDSACEILNAIDREYLAVWDYYPLIISIREQLLGILLIENWKSLITEIWAAHISKLAIRKRAWSIINVLCRLPVRMGIKKVFADG